VGTTFTLNEPYDDWDVEAFVAAEGYTIDYSGTTYDVGRGHTGRITLKLNETLTLVERVSMLSKIEDLGTPDSSSTGRGTTYNYWALGLGSALDGVAWHNDSGKLRAVNLTGFARVQGDDPIVDDDLVTLRSMNAAILAAAGLLLSNILITESGGLVWDVDSDGDSFFVTLS
jgi:hypothetical protein